MTTTFKVRENKNWWREPVTNRDEGRYEVVQLDDGHYVATTGASSSSRAAAKSAAADMQADEDAGVTIQGMLADDWRAIDAGLATALREYYDKLPALVTEIGLEQAEARHPWRMSQFQGASS